MGRRVRELAVTLCVLVMLKATSTKSHYLDYVKARWTGTAKDGPK